jgi:RES domain-containing protein
MTDWRADAAIAGCPVRPWSGSAWRCHGRKYAGDDAAGSLLVTGRYHRGRDKFPEDETWPALYTALAIHVALGERIRHTTPESLQRMKTQRFSELEISLQRVLNLCAADSCATHGLRNMEETDLCHPIEYTSCHQIAELARDVAEAMIVPSCTGFPEGNLIIFPDRCHPESTIRVVQTIDPNLYVDWHEYE